MSQKVGTAIACFCLIALSPLVLWGPNRLLLLLAVVVLVGGLVATWRVAESQILTVLFLHQWLQAALLIFVANANEVSVRSYSVAGGDTRAGSLWALAAVFSLALGMRFGVGRKRPSDVAWAAQLMAIPQRRIFWLYIVGLCIQALSILIMRAIPGLTQLMLPLAGLKWAAFFLLSCVTLVNPRANRTPWLIAFGFEFMSALGAYFSEFKIVFFYTLLAVLSIGSALSQKQIKRLCLLAVFMFGFAIVWTSVKVDYRHYASQGELAQVVKVEYTDRIAKLAELVANVDGEAMLVAFERLLLRVAYVDYFSGVLARVPRTLPHTSGELLFDALRRPFMPRLFFPDKSAIDDSLQTNKYSGARVAGYAQGTSISIGYVSELYIDFGRLGMILLVFVLGSVIGRISRWLHYGRHSRGILGAAIATTTLMPALYFETSLAKVVGALVSSTLIAWVATRFVVPKAVPWLTPLVGSRHVQENRG